MKSLNFSQRRSSTKSRALEARWKFNFAEERFERRDAPSITSRIAGSTIRKNYFALRREVRRSDV